MSGRRLKKRRAGRARRASRLPYIAAIVVFVLSFLFTLRVSVTPSHEIARIVEQQLRAFGVGPKLTIREAWVEPLNLAVVLGGVKLGDDDHHPDVEIAYVRVELTFDWKEKVQVSRVVIDRPVIQALSLEKLLPKSLPETPSGPQKLPVVVLQHGSMRVDTPEVGALDFTDISVMAVPSGESEVRLAGTALTPLRGSMRVGGTVDLATGRIEMRGATVSEVDLETTAGAALNSQIEEWRVKLKPAGHVGMHLQLLRDDAKAPLQFHADVTATGLAATIPKIDVRPTDVKLRVTLDNSLEARVAAEGRVLGATMTARGLVRFDPKTLGFVRAEVGTRVRELYLGRELHRILSVLDRGVAEVYAGLDPEGPVDVQLSVAKDGDSPKIDIAADLDFRQGAITFRGFPGSDDKIDAAFPYRLTDVEGRISYRDQRVWLAGVRAKMGAGTVAAAGELWGTGRVGIDLAVHAEGVELDDRIAEAIPSLPGGAEAWPLFDLYGKVGFDVHVTRPQGQIRAHVIVKVRSNGDVAGTYRDFPLLVEELAGDVTFDRGTAVFAFNGVCSDGPVRVEGLVDGGADEKGAEPERTGIRLRIVSRRFKLDRFIGNYFSDEAPGLTKFLNDLEPKTRVDFEYRGERPRNAKTGELEAMVAMQGDRGVIRRVPRVDVELDDVSASLRIFASPRPGADPTLRVLLDSIKGNYRGQTVRVVGSYSSEDVRKPGAKEADPLDSVEVRAAGFDLPFNKDLIQSMAKAGSSQAGHVVERYEFGGRFDVFLSHKRTPLVDSTDVQLELRHAAVSGPGIPGTLRDCEGRLSVDGEGRLQSESISGKLDGIPVRFDQFLLAPATPSTPVHVEAVMSSLGTMDLIETVGKTNPAVRDWLAGVEFNAQVQPTGMAWKLDMPEQGAPSFRVDRGTFQFKEGWALPGALVSKLEGVAELKELIYDGDGFRTELLVRDMRYSAFGIPVDHFSGSVTLSPELLSISRATGVLAEGKLTSQTPDRPFLAVKMTTEPREWSMSARLENGRLERLSVVNGKSIGSMQGPVTCDVALNGAGATLRSLSGRGSLDAHKAQLIDLPGSKPLYENLELKKAPAFTDCEATFGIRNGIITFERLFFDSEPLALDGGGIARLDGTLDLVFRPRLHSMLNPGNWFVIGFVLSPFFNLLQDWLLEVRMVGTFDNPMPVKRSALTRSSDDRRKQVIAPEPPLDLGERF